MKTLTKVVCFSAMPGLVFAAWAAKAEASEVKTCSRTAAAAMKACSFEARDDFWIAVGTCLNTSLPEAQKIAEGGGFVLAANR